MGEPDREKQCKLQWLQQPVGRFKNGTRDSFDANGFGLYDTSGNVWDWVEDCYRDSHPAFLSRPYNAAFLTSVSRHGCARAAGLRTPVPDHRR
ncbi:MAG: SUMF1/EgtB/PvdO family nonheme iron enzyme [Pseudomonadota bacterium]|nr:SUMF1/EgtB/PvdO family nonheme iron enzyme [Pseudomonadota bacterium]